MIFRRDPVLQLPDNAAAVTAVLNTFVNDVDLLGTTLDSYGKKVVTDVISVGRSGTLVDWQGESESRAYLNFYAAESIRNWRQIRIDGHLILSLVVLSESAAGDASADDPFVAGEIPQLRVLKL